MGTGLGIERDAQGNGTDELDMQRIIASLFDNPGTLTGLKVFTRSDWAYVVTAGSEVFDVGADLSTISPFDEVTLTPKPAPATGTATDTIYVKQDIPASDGGSNLAWVGIARNGGGVTETVPDGARVLSVRSVPAGATATNSTTETHDRQFAQLSGANLGMLGTFRDTNTAPHRYDVVTSGQVRVVLHTDRVVDIRVSSTVTRCDSTGATMQGNLRASLRYRIFIDGQQVRAFEREYGRVWDTLQFTTTEHVRQGPHTIHYEVERVWTDPGINADADYWAVRYGGAEKHHGDALTVFDRGVWE